LKKFIKSVIISTMGTKKSSKGSAPRVSAPKTATQKKVRFEDIDTSALVNADKARRAFEGVFGGAKSESAELTLAQTIRAEKPELKGEELVHEVYKGLGGLVDVTKAKKNRENEARDRKRRASK
jgi:hypothetical protein